MKALGGAFLGLLALVAGCDGSTPAGVSVSSSSGTGATEASTMERTRTQTASTTASQRTETSAGALLFPALAADLAAGIDKAMARKGPDALTGSDVDQLRQVFHLAARPLLGWPVDPIDNQMGARRWASTMAAAVITTDEAAQQIAAALPARAMSDQEQAQEAIRKAFAGLDHAGLMKTFRHRAKEPVTLDLAGAAAVRFVTQAGPITVDDTGATWTRAGGVRFSGAAGTFGGRTYTVALERAGGLTMTKQRGEAQSTTAQRESSTGAEAGVK